MNEIFVPTAPYSTGRLPALFQTTPEGGRRFWEFFTVNVRNPNTRRAYFKADEMRELLVSIDTASLLGLRDRALIALMGYTFARVGAATGMKVEDFYVQKRRGWVRLHEKGGKVTELPCHHNLDQYLEEWVAVSGLGSEPEAPLFPTLRHGRLTGRTPMPQANIHMMIQRRAKVAGLKTKISPQFPRYRHNHLPAERRQAGDSAVYVRA